MTAFRAGGQNAAQGAVPPLSDQGGVVLGRRALAPYFPAPSIADLRRIEALISSPDPLPPARTGGSWLAGLWPWFRDQTASAPPSARVARALKAFDEVERPVTTIAAPRTDIPGMLALDADRIHDRILRDPIRKSCTRVFFGDSLTENWQTAGEGAWKQYFAATSLDAGVGGDRTQNLLWRMDHGALDNLPHAKVVVLDIGLNNIGTGQNTPEDTAAGVDAVITKIREKLPEAKILLEKLLPAKQDPHDYFRGQIAKTNALLAELAQRRGIRFHDASSCFVNADGTFKPGVMQGDWLHPAAAGYACWAPAILKEIEQLEGH